MTVSTSAYSQTGVDLPDPEPIQAPEPREAPFDAQGWYESVARELPENFKDPRAFVDSYKNLERRLTDMAREKQEAEEYASAMAEQMNAQEDQRLQQQPQQFDPQANPLLQQWERAFNPYEPGTPLEQMGLVLHATNQMIEQRRAEELSQPNEAAQAQELAQASLFARAVDQDVQTVYEEKYQEPWVEVKRSVGDFLAENPHWLENMSTTEEAVSRIAQAADLVRSQNLGSAAEQAGNPQRANAQAKYLGQTLMGHGARTQASQSAADDLVERMRSLQGPYAGYSS